MADKALFDANEFSRIMSWIVGKNTDGQTELKDFISQSIRLRVGEVLDEIEKARDASDRGFSLAGIANEIDCIRVKYGL